MERGNARGIRFIFYKCDVPSCEHRKYLLAFSIGWYKLRSWWLAVAELEATLEGKKFYVSPTPYACRLVRFMVGGCVYLRELREGIRRWLQGEKTAEFSKYLPYFDELLESDATGIRNVDPRGNGTLEVKANFPNTIECQV